MSAPTNTAAVPVAEVPIAEPGGAWSEGPGYVIAVDAEAWADLEHRLIHPRKPTAALIRMMKR